MTISPLVYASNQPQASNNIDAQIKAVADELVSELAPLVYETRRPYTVFNYYHDSPAIEAMSPYQRIKQATDRTWALYNSSQPTSSYEAGNGNAAHTVSGFYAALDPLETAEYGGADSKGWGLLAVELPKGFRYLYTGDMSNPSDGTIIYPTLRSKARDGLAQFKCTTKISTLLLSPSSMYCGRIAAWVINELRLDAVMYPFGYRPSLSICKWRPATALLMTDAHKLQHAKILAMNAKSDLSPAPSLDLALYQAVIKYYISNGNRFDDQIDFAKHRQWKSVQPISDLRVQQWIHENIFGCGDTSERQSSIGIDWDLGPEY